VSGLRSSTAILLAVILGAQVAQAGVRDLLLRGATGTHDLGTVPPVKVTIRGGATPGLASKSGTPRLNLYTQVGVGEPLYTEGATSSAAIHVEAVQLQDTVAVSGGGYQILAGSYMARWAKDETSWCTDEILQAGKPVREPAVVCLDDANSDGVFNQISVSSYPRPLVAPQARYRRVAFQTQATTATQGSTRRLVYLGSGGGVLRLRYEEDGQPPADVAYDLSKDGPTSVSFKGARMEISSATNEGIQYQVLSGFAPGSSAPARQAGLADRGAEGVRQEPLGNCPLKFSIPLEGFDRPDMKGRIFYDAQVCDKARVGKVWVGKSIERGRVTLEITPTVSTEHYRQDVDLTVAVVARGVTAKHKTWDNLTVGDDNSWANKAGAWVAAPSTTKRPVATFTFKADEYAGFFGEGPPTLEVLLEVQE